MQPDLPLRNAPGLPGRRSRPRPQFAQRRASPLNRSRATAQPGGHPTYLAQLGLATVDRPYSLGRGGPVVPPGPRSRCRPGGEGVVHHLPERCSHSLTSQRSAPAGTLRFTVPDSDLPPASRRDHRPSSCSACSTSRSSNGRPRAARPECAPDPRREASAYRRAARVLERGVDYNISYDVGQVTFLNPNVLFGVEPCRR